MGEFGKNESSYAQVRDIAERCAAIHRAITERFGDAVEIIQIEPRAYLYILPKVLFEILRFNRSLSAVVKAAFLWYPIPIVIVNGRLVGAGRLPTADDVIRELCGGGN
ncbi:MAG: hypothetical protein ACT4NX_01275 [Deltaproteobacteria bacterium]